VTVTSGISKASRWQSHPQTPKHGRSRGHWGQRQLASWWARWCTVATLVLCLPSLAPAFTDAIEPTHTVDLPAFPLAISQADGWIVVSLGLSGVAFIQELPWEAEEPQIVLRNSWKTLSVTPLEDGGMLLAGRDGTLRHVLSDPPGSEPQMLAEWGVEGTPNQVVLRDEVLYVASGGAGVTVWDWPDRSESPVLRGRYPFVEFARRISADPMGNRVYVADSIGGRVAMLDVSDPMRPHLEKSYQVGSFCDSVHVGVEFLFFTDRNIGAYSARRSIHASTDEPWVLHQQFQLLSPYTEHRDAKQLVVLRAGESFLLCEALGGVRQWHLNPDDGRFHETARYRTRGAAMDAVMIDGGRIAVADHPHGVSIFTLPQ